MPRVTDPNGDVIRPVALHGASGRLLGSGAQTVVNALAIRDTASRDFILDCAGYPRRMLAVLSTLDQPLTLLLGFSADPLAAVGAAEREVLTVPANGTRWIGPEGASSGAFLAAPSLANYSEGVFLRLACAVAPTSGSVTVYLIRNAF